MSGLFISVEGTDGSGKTTQIELLKKYFEDRKYCVVCTREPGSTLIGEKLREIIIDVNNSEMKDTTEVLLYAAARAELVGQVIMPALKSGSIVISDRFIDSSIVYQGYARNVDIKDITQINNFATMGALPDITFFLKLDSEEAMERKREQKSLDRIESENSYFHKRVYAGYMDIAKKNPERIKVINAAATIEEVHNEIVEKINSLIKERGI
jgi:dTMP kinase